VEEYDITQLHENTYYKVCVNVFTTTQLPGNNDYENLDRQSPGTDDVWNNYDVSETGLSNNNQFFHQSAAGNQSCVPHTSKN